MEHQPTGSTGAFAGSGKCIVLLFALVILLCFPGNLFSQNGEGKSVLSPSGILYPGGYDTNTVGEILGRIESINSPESGPVQLQVLSGRDRYIILTAPVLYWKSPGERILGGMEILAKGSKALGADGKLYLIAQEIRNPKTGDTVVLRKEDGTPVWAERNFGASGRAEFGSSMRGGGGSMRGPGRGGHGRR